MTEDTKMSKPVVGLDEDDIQVLTNIVSKTFESAKSQGKYDMRPDIGPLLMHVVSEITEAMSAKLANSITSEEALQLSSALLGQPMFKQVFQSTVKDSFGDELADVVLLIFSIAGYYNLPIAKHIQLKYAYNECRDMHSNFNEYTTTNEP